MNKCSMSVPLLGRTAPFRGVRLLDAHPAPRQRLAQQQLDLGVGATQLGGGHPLDCGEERRIETEGEGFLGGCSHHSSSIERDRKSTTSELQSLMRISYAVFCLKNKKKNMKQNNTTDSYI